MSDKHDYQKRAVDCAARAALAANDKTREVWREMEKYWRKRADENRLPVEIHLTPKRAKEHV